MPESRAEFEFFYPDDAPGELLAAIQTEKPGVTVEWLMRARDGSGMGDYLTGVIPDWIRTKESVGELVLPTGDTLTYGYLLVAPVPDVPESNKQAA